MKETDSTAAAPSSRTAGTKPPASADGPVAAKAGRGERDKPPAPKGVLAASSDQPVALSWIEEDIENRWGFFKGGRYTGANKLFAMLVGLVLAGAFYGVLLLCHKRVGALDDFIQPFIRESNLWTVVPGMFLFFWAMTALWIKHQKIKFQRRALDLAAVPQQPGFVLTEATAKTVLERIHGLVDHPQHFILLNRIERALSSLHNLGGLNDVSAILKGQAENDENQINSSYTLINGMVWATPVLGFIGTVLGLSQAIGKFTGALQVPGGDLGAIKTELQKVTNGLATAFETTLVALVCALVIQLYINFLQQQEADFLDECNDYCHAHVISKLRLIERPVMKAPDEEEAG